MAVPGGAPIHSGRRATPSVARSADYDLTDPQQVRILSPKPTRITSSNAATVIGGIGANRRHASRFIFANAGMGIHLIHESWRGSIN